MYICLVFIGILSFLPETLGTELSYCKDGHSEDRRNCMEVCTSGSASAKDSKPALSPDILAKALSRCKSPKDLNTAGGGNQECEQCKSGWGGPYCTKESIKYELFGPKYNASRKMKDNKRRSCGVMRKANLTWTTTDTNDVELELQIKDGEEEKLEGCKFKTCCMLNSSSNVARLKCTDRKPEITIRCKERIKICGIKIYAQTTPSSATTAKHETAASKESESKVLPITDVPIVTNQTTVLSTSTEPESSSLTEQKSSTDITTTVAESTYTSLNEATDTSATAVTVSSGETTTSLNVTGTTGPDLLTTVSEKIMTTKAEATTATSVKAVASSQVSSTRMAPTDSTEQDLSPTVPEKTQTTEQEGTTPSREATTLPQVSSAMPDETDSTKPGLSTSTEPGLSTSTEPGLSTNTESGLSTSTESGLSTSTEPGLSTSTEPGLSTSTESGLSTSTEPGLSTSTEPDLSSSTESGLSTSTEPGLSTSSEPDLSTSTEPGLSTGTEPGLPTSAEPDLSTSTEPDLSTSVLDNGTVTALETSATTPIEETTAGFYSTEPTLPTLFPESSTATESEIPTTIILEERSSSTTEGKDMTVEKVDDDDEGNGGTDSLAGPLIGLFAVLLLGAVIALVVFRIKKKQRGDCKGIVASEDGEILAEDNVSNGVQFEMNQHGSSLAHHSVERSPSDSSIAENGSEYLNVSEVFSVTSDPIPLDAFRNHLCSMESAKAFDKEYQVLPRGVHSPVRAANQANEGEVKKNRFKDILPYDDCRVYLQKDTRSDSDYINASFIDGYAEIMAYIAAQGPLPDTIEDFWRMVWSEGCGKIVMLTNLIETGKPKCELYWPDEEGKSQTFGRYTLTSIKVTKRTFFVHRVLGLSKRPSNNKVPETTRQIHHFHFTAWPDHGVPCAMALIQFWSLVSVQSVQLAGPVLVHCSAGVGRTGTYIALDMLTHQAETSGQVSIYPTVRRLRKQRVNMVQTVSQYKFLHEVVAEWLAFRGSDLVKHDLMHGSHWKEGKLQNQIPSDVKQKLNNQFQMLDQLRPKVSKQQTATASLRQNAQKNRSPAILPVGQYRVCLWTPDDKTSDYINAVFLPSMTCQRGYIVTQLPLENTVADFWQMVQDWRVKVIVQFMDAPKLHEVELFPRQGQSVQHGSLTVHNQNKTAVTQGVSLHTLYIRQQPGTQNSGCQVKVFSVRSPGALSMKKTAAFVWLINTLLPMVMSGEGLPVLIQCFDGAGLSCILSNLMMAAESLEMDNTASPYLLARLIHNARPQAFRKYEEYEFVVRCLLHLSRGVTDDDGGENLTEEESEVCDDDAHIYGNL